MHYVPESSRALLEGESPTGTPLDSEGTGFHVASAPVYVLTAAVGISAGGSENSRLSVLDAASGATLAGPIDRAQFGSPAWLDDGSGLFFLRMQALHPDSKPTIPIFRA